MAHDFHRSMGWQPCVVGRNIRVGGDLPRADMGVNPSFWMMVYPGSGESQLGHYAHELEEFFGVGF